MSIVKMEIEISEDMLEFIDYNSPDYKKKIKEFMLYQAVKEQKISFGKAAELLGMDKLSYIQDLSELGISYFDMGKDELQQDIDVIENLLEG